MILANDGIAVTHTRSQKAAKRKPKRKRAKPEEQQETDGLGPEYADTTQDQE